MKLHLHLIVIFTCCGIVLYNSIVHVKIINHPYMVGMIITLLLVAVYHMVLMTYKVLKK